MPQTQNNPTKRVDSVDFFVSGAQLGWNTMSSKIRNGSSPSTPSKYTFSFQKVVESEKKLWIDAKSGKVYNKGKGKEVNLVNQVRTQHHLTNLNPLQKWAGRKRYALKMLLQVLLWEEIEYYTIVVKTNYYARSERQFEDLGQAMVKIPFPTNFNEEKFLGQYLSYGMESWNLATCVVSKAKITFEMYVSPLHAHFWYFLLSTLLILPIILYFAYVWKTPKLERKYGHWGFVYNISAIYSFLETSPDPTKQIISNPTTKRTYRILVGNWSIIAVFFAAVYRNEFVVNTIVPIGAESNLTRFSQLDSFHFYAPRELVYSASNLLGQRGSNFVFLFTIR